MNLYDSLDNSKGPSASPVQQKVSPAQNKHNYFISKCSLSARPGSGSEFERIWPVRTSGSSDRVA